jgi:hypothetical protein
MFAGPEVRNLMFGDGSGRVDMCRATTSRMPHSAWRCVHLRHGGEHRQVRARGPASCLQEQAVKTHRAMHCTGCGLCGRLRVRGHPNEPRKRNSERFCSMCAEVCEACAQEYDSQQVQHCEKCARECRRCAQECRNMAETIRVQLRQDFCGCAIFFMSTGQSGAAEGAIRNPTNL